MSGTDEKENIRNEFAALAIAEGVEPRFVDAYYELVFEIATGLVSRGGRIVVGISGAQGTGKSTLAKMIAIALERAFERTTLVMSLDDFYLTRAEREQLARDVHPLLRTRGVPGTHDMGLLRRVLDHLRVGRSTEVPVFDKAIDDRSGMVPVMGADLDILVIEGWCIGAQPVSDDRLERPVNDLERELDPDGAWRRYVNGMLRSGGYQEAFREIDALFFLAAPDMETVFQWRWQQERKLAERNAVNELGSKRAIMTEEEVRRFIMYYERITRRMLKDMPSRANLTLYLDDRHQLRQPPRS